MGAPVIPWLLGVGVLATALVLRWAYAAGPAVAVRGRLVAAGTAGPAERGSRPTWQVGRRRAPDPVVRWAGKADLVPVPRWLWPGWPALAAAGLLGGWVAGGAGAALVFTVVAAAGPAAVLWLNADRAERRLAAGLPDLLEAVARSLRSGAGLRQALTDAVDATPGLAGRELRPVLTAVGRGASLVDELDRWAERRPLPAVRLTVAALALGARTGGAQASAVDGVAATLRDRQAVDGEVRALSSQARASVLVMVVAPLAFAGLAVLPDPEAATFLLRRPVGLACLGAGLALDALAGLWMHRITASGGGR